MTDDPTRSAEALSRRQMRGSLLLLVGRGLALLLTTTTQILLVRGLSVADYGAFAYAFVLAAAGRTMLSLGQGKMLSRFMAKYEEEQDWGRMFGAMALAAATIAVTSGLAISVLLLFKEDLAGSAVDDPAAIAVLAVLIFLAPLEALDQVFVSVFAVLSRARSIFFRKYLLTPLLRLVAVATVVATGASPTTLALAYVGTGVVGIVVYLLLLRQVLAARGLLTHLRPRRLVIPAREVLGLALPTLTADLVLLSMSAGSVVILGRLGGVNEVAEYRAVFPAAHLNQFVFASFATLFLPMVGRLAARQDLVGLRLAYWQSAAVIAVLTFPVAALTGPFAPESTVALFGERYETSSTVLVLLALGYYVNSSLGFNAYTLQVLGRPGVIVVNNVAAAGVNLALCLPLAARFDAVGVAAANAATLVLLNLANQVALTRAVGGPFMPREFVGTYAQVVVLLGLLALTRLLPGSSIVLALAASAAAGLVLLRLSRRTLQLDQVMPELARVPVVGRLLRP